MKASPCDHCIYREDNVRMRAELIRAKILIAKLKAIEADPFQDEMEKDLQTHDLIRAFNE